MKKKKERKRVRKRMGREIEKGRSSWINPWLSDSSPFTEIYWWVYTHQVAII